MTYYTGCIAAVPTANKEKFIAHVKAGWPMLRRHGATRLIESWGVDVPRGKVNDLYGAVEAREGETVIFSWIEWPDRASADAGWAAMQDDPTGKAMPPLPFDGSRMIFGGFEPVMTAGSDGGVGYVQGFALAVPEKNRAAYVAMAREAWKDAFEPHGCLGIVEAWGADVPRGTRTDFYRATMAKDGEMPLFSWTAWPDKATCDAAAKAMEAEMAGKEFPEMPFDGKRMMWGGFEPVFDSAAARQETTR